MTPFTPGNPLEKVLLAAQSGAVEPAALFQRMYLSQVFVLLDKQPDPDGKWDKTTSLMVLNNARGEPMMAIFTAPERSQDWPAQAPAFRHGILVDFPWVLKGMAAGVGIVVNPGCSVGVEMSADIVQKLKDGLA